jgi:hypothetical protein
MMARGGAAGALVLLWLMVACAPERPTPSWNEGDGFRWRELVVAAGEPGFTRMDGRASGIDFENTVSDSLLARNRILGQGAGVALGDFDGDGWVDIFLARTEGPNALYRNLGDWRFEDIAAQAGVAATDRHSSGAAFADIEGDGDLDLVLLATRGPNAVFVNDGTGHFAEHHADIGIDPRGKGGTTVAMADVDGDGDLDLYIANYKAYHLEDSIPPQEYAFSQMVRQVGPNRFEIVPEYRSEYKLVMRPDMGGLRMSARAEPDDFYLSDGGVFRRIPLTSDRFRDASGKPLVAEPESFTLAATFADLTMDGAPDLYVANDFEDTDEFWINDGHGSFRLADWTVQRQMSNSSMGVDVADVDGDARPDLFAVDMLSNDSRRLKTQMPTHTPLPKVPGDIATQLQQQRNTLFRNRGDGTFSELSLYAGVEASGWSWSTMFLDVDLDGWQDLLITNGHLWDVMDADVQERLQNRLTAIDWRRLKWEYPPLPLRNVAFRNRGDMTFEDASERWGFGVEDDISHTIAAGDLDGDGDLDAVVNRLRSPALVLRNDAPAPRIAVRLVGPPPNTRAVGARIRLLGGAVPQQAHEVEVGGLYMSHSDYQIAFAMGTSDSAELIVDWRDGRRTVIPRVRPNRLYEITAITALAPAEDDAESDSPPPLFSDATAELDGHRHVDPPFDDWERQLLLPNALSLLGPGIAWFDIDRDRDEDLVVGSGRGGRLGVFRNDGGRLTPVPPAGPVAPADLTTVLGFATTDGPRLLAGVSSWESSAAADPSPSAMVVRISGGALAAGPEAIIPSIGSATGPVALGDLDGDGDLDLFVGGRAVPGQYPRAASSGLFRNDGGRFVADSAHAGAFEQVGLVSAALFADVDADGDADLLLAREWDSILLLLNDDGRLRAAPASWGLERWTSRWNGLAAGDLDGDGRLDLIATSWGRNTSTPADSARPLVLLHGAFGSRGEEELLVAREDPRVGGLAPLNSYPRVRITIRDLARRVGSFAAYADARIDQILGPQSSTVRRKVIVTLDHMAFINRGGRFEAVALPAEAQLAPAFYAGVADFDGDGFEDVLLSQNFYPTAMGLPRYDGGRGLLLSGDGTGKLAAIPGTRSGIVVYGDQRGAAYSDFDGDGRLDLVVSQNSGPTRLFRNRMAKRGLRVRLEGSASNPDGVGAQIRVAYGDRMGPVREIHAGSGYWSQNGAVQVFGLAATPTAVWVRWTGGVETRAPVPAGASEIVVRRAR